MRWTVLTLWVVVSGLAIADWNLNDDCIVNLEDFALFAADWQDPYDVNDLAGFATEWLTYTTLDRAPVAINQSLSVFNNATKTVTLSATDENSDPIQYSVQSLPTGVQGEITGISSVPTILGGNTFVFDPNDSYAGTVSIQFGADDQTGLQPPCGGLDLGVITITVYAEPTNPTAANVNTSAVANVMTGIELDASDDGWPAVPGKIQTIITALPTNGTLQDPSNGYAVIDSVPYTLANWGNTVVFISSTTGNDTFHYKAFDGGYPPLDGYSNTATVTVTVAANLADSLYFDGAGTVTFADQAAYDITDGWAMDFGILCEPGAVDFGLMRKYSGSGKGWELGLVSGKLKLYLHDGSSTKTARFFNRIDDGAWHEVSVVFYADPNTVKIEVDAAGKLFVQDYLADYANSEPLIIGTHTRQGYQGNLDKLRFFSGMDINNQFQFLQGLSGRTVSTGEVVLGAFGKASDVLFMFDEGSGTTVTDSKLGYTGSLSSSQHVLWTPPVSLFTTTPAAMYRILNGGDE